jgi:hypothetical protein
MYHARTSWPTSVSTRVDTPIDMFHATPRAACFAIDIEDQPWCFAIQRMTLSVSFARAGEIDERMIGIRVVHTVEPTSQLRAQLEQLIHMTIRAPWIARMRALLPPARLVGGSRNSIELFIWEP